jgi:hypothetical protein
VTEQTVMFPELMVGDPTASLQRSLCKGCGSEMAWATTTSGASVPLDPAPVADGNLVFVGKVVRYLHKGERVPEGMPRYRSHFSTCPEAGRFRRGRGTR